MSRSRDAHPIGCAKCGQDHPRCAGHVERCQSCRATGGNTVGNPCASCGHAEVVLEPCRRWPTRGSHVCTSHGSSTKLARAAAAKAVERAEAEGEVERFRGQLGVEAVDEPLEVTALREIRRARGDLAAWQAAVDELTATGGLDALGVHTGNEKKPNEVEKHFVLARRDEERDRLMGWIATARKLGIEEARLEHEQRLAEAEAERLVAVIRVTLESSKVSLLEAGAPADVVEVWFRERVPSIVRTAIEATSQLVASEVTS